MQQNVTREFSYGLVRRTDHHFGHVFEKSVGFFLEPRGTHVLSFKFVGYFSAHMDTRTDFTIVKRLCQILNNCKMVNGRLSAASVECEKDTCSGDTLVTITPRHL
ncbi:hypothetical protein J6590_094215 [Homalodisca vitripennis]|nr:hypothetical protein J6590_094215 [Homalodisca vitripennis]